MNKLSLLHHAGNDRMCRIPELEIKGPLAECHGGGYHMPREQAEKIVAIVNAAIDWAADREVLNNRPRDKTEIALFRAITSNRETLNPKPTGNAKLDELIKKSCDWFNSLSIEEQQEHRRQQMASWVRGEMELNKDPRFR